MKILQIWGRPYWSNGRNKRTKWLFRRTKYDGSSQGKTAWMTELYKGEEDYRGYSWYQDERVKKYVSIAINDNGQLLTYCNGDAASDQLLTNYKAALK